MSVTKRSLCDEKCSGFSGTWQVLTVMPLSLSTLQEFVSVNKSLSHGACSACEISPNMWCKPGKRGLCPVSFSKRVKFQWVSLLWFPVCWGRSRPKKFSNTDLRGNAIAVLHSRTRNWSLSLKSCRWRAFVCMYLTLSYRNVVNVCYSWESCPNSMVKGTIFRM